MTTFRYEEVQTPNSKVIKRAYWGWLENDTEDGSDYERGMCIQFPNESLVFYPASRSEYNALTNNVSAGQFYNVFIRGREGAVDIDDVEEAQAGLTQAGLAVDVAEAQAVTNVTNNAGTVGPELERGYARVALDLEFAELADFLATYDDVIVSVRYDG